MRDKGRRSAPAISDDDAQQRWLLVSDVDETITGDDDALRRFIQAVEQTDDLLVCLNSSRPQASVDRTLAGFPLAFAPDALITGMGTAIRLGSENLAAWSDRFAGWDRRVIDDVMRQLGYRAHPADLQTPCKASFAVPRGEDQRKACEAIDATGLPTHIIVSGESDFDVLPPGSGKDMAALFLARHLNVPLSRMIVAGDSRNDLAMFEVSHHGVVVGNARDELRDALRERNGVYFAQRSHAAGVLEGLRHWNVPIAQPQHNGIHP